MKRKSYTQNKQVILQTYFVQRSSQIKAPISTLIACFAGAQIYSPFTALSIAIEVWPLLIYVNRWPSILLADQLEYYFLYDSFR